MTITIVIINQSLHHYKTPHGNNHNGILLGRDHFKPVTESGDGQLGQFISDCLKWSINLVDIEQHERIQSSDITCRDEEE